MSAGPRVIEVTIAVRTGKRQPRAERTEQLRPGHCERGRGGRDDDPRGRDDRRELGGDQPGGAQRLEEQDGQHHGGGPRPDDEVSQADHDECVTAGQDARGWTRLL